MPSVQPARGLPQAIAPKSLPLPVAVVAHHPADAPVPGTVPATPYDPYRPLQHTPGPALAVFRSAPNISGGHGPIDADLTAAQFAMVAGSRAKLDRARSYAYRLEAHTAEIRAKLAAAVERQVAAAIGTVEPAPADVGPLRVELIEVDRQHRQALDGLADIEAEHARHEADFATLTGSDGAARASLSEGPVANFRR